MIYSISDNITLKLSTDKCSRCVLLFLSTVLLKGAAKGPLNVLAHAKSTVRKWCRIMSPSGLAAEVAAELVRRWSELSTQLRPYKRVHTNASIQMPPYTHVHTHYTHYTHAHVWYHISFVYQLYIIYIYIYINYINYISFIYHLYIICIWFLYDCYMIFILNIYVY